MSTVHITIHTDFTADNAAYFGVFSNPDGASTVSPQQALDDLGAVARIVREATGVKVRSCNTGKPKEWGCRSNHACHTPRHSSHVFLCRSFPTYASIFAHQFVPCIVVTVARPKNAKQAQPAFLGRGNTFGWFMSSIRRIEQPASHVERGEGEQSGKRSFLE